MKFKKKKKSARVSQQIILKLGHRAEKRRKKNHGGFVLLHIQLAVERWEASGTAEPAELTAALQVAKLTPKHCTFPTGGKTQKRHKKPEKPSQ